MFQVIHANLFPMTKFVSLCSLVHVRIHLPKWQILSLWDPSTHTTDAGTECPDL